MHKERRRYDGRYISQHGESPKPRLTCAQCLVYAGGPSGCECDGIDIVVALYGREVRACARESGARAGGYYTRPVRTAACTQCLVCEPALGGGGCDGSDILVVLHERSE